MKNRKLEFLSYLQKQNGNPVDINTDLSMQVSYLGAQDLKDLFDDLLIISFDDKTINLTTDGFLELIKNNCVTWNKEALHMIKSLVDDLRAVKVQTPSGSYYKAA